MQQTATLPARTEPIDHKQLPDEDGSFVHNFQEHPQSELLTSCLLPRLHQVYPHGQFAIGHNCGIYWRQTKEPLEGCKAPDWFLVPNVPPMLNGECRRSYVLWQEVVRPLLVIEHVSGDGQDERDATPFRGKFWVYEQAIVAQYYAIYEVAKPAIELYGMSGGHYTKVPANAKGRYPIPELGIELGIWEGTFRSVELPWLRVWDAATGLILLTEGERAETERLRAETERLRAEAAEGLVDDFRKQVEEESERAEKERKRAEEAEQFVAQQRIDHAKLIEKLRAAGIDPDAG